MTHETPDNLQKAVDAYTGPITKCRPGKARARTVKPRVRDRAEQWLNAHSADQPKEDRHDEERMWSLRIEQQRQRQRRDDKRNAPAIRQANRERRIADLRRKNTVG